MPSKDSSESIKDTVFESDDRKSDGTFAPKGTGDQTGGKSDDKPTDSGTKQEKPKKQNWMPKKKELQEQAEYEAEMAHTDGEWDYDMSKEEKKEAIEEQKEKIIAKAEQKHKQNNIDTRTEKFSQKKHDELIEISWRMMTPDERDNAIQHIGAEQDKWREKYSFQQYGMTFAQARDQLGDDSYAGSLYDGLLYSGDDWGSPTGKGESTFLGGKEPDYDLDKFEKINNDIISGYKNSRKRLKDSEKKMKQAQRVLDSLSKKGELYKEAGEDVFRKVKDELYHNENMLKEYEDRLKATKEMSKKMKSLSRDLSGESLSNFDFEDIKEGEEISEKPKAVESDCGCDTFEKFVDVQMKCIKLKAKEGQDYGLLYDQPVVEGKKIKGTLAYAGVSLNNRLYLPEELAKGDGMTVPLILNHASTAGAEQELDRLPEKFKQGLEQGLEMRVGEVTLRWEPDDLTLYYEGVVEDEFFIKEIDEMNMAVSLGMYYDSDSPQVCDRDCYTMIKGAEFHEVSLVYHAGFPIATIEANEALIRKKAIEALNFSRSDDPLNEKIIANEVETGENKARLIKSLKSISMDINHD